jgi:hypothetical protein
VIASLILITTLAQAAAPAGNAEAKSRAKALLGEGTRFYDQGEFAPALEKFTQAYAEYASPKLLYNIAQTKRALGRLAEAMDAFERFLLEPPDDTTEMIGDAHTSMAELQAKVGRLHIECAKPRVEVSVDGKVVGLTPLPDLLWAEPGKHQITARHADTIPVVEDVEVVVGRIRNVVLLVQALDSAAVSTTPATRTAQSRLGLEKNQAPSSDGEVSTSGEGTSGWWLGRKWTWVAAGSTVALVAAATVMSVSMQSKFDSLNNSCGSGSGNADWGCTESDVSSVTSRKNTANVLWALSGAAAVTTGILFFVEGRRVDLAPTVAGAPGLTARMSY